ncbi:MAG: twin-arginine translocation signal domain-containing protein, partial [Gemmataceae bacterium]|nr:twin-arginine translocation signal domain-containing protein [Gemmataceae bacterium]
MSTRRDFLKTTLGASSLLAVGGAVPEFLASTALAADKDDKEKGDKKKDTVLVVIELEGGNDGLNTVAPYGDDLYQKARPTLAFGKKDVLKIDDYHGLHPRMQQMKQLYDQKRLAVIQGVGYPNPDRSHFESMDIW